MAAAASTSASTGGGALQDARDVPAALARQEPEIEPADPRGGNLGIRSATFKRAPGLLDFQVLVMREDRQGAPFQGTLTFSIQGTYPNGRSATITPEGAPVNVDRYDYAMGQLKLPDGFTSKVVTLRVVDAAQKQHAMRIYYVRN